MRRSLSHIQDAPGRSRSSGRSRRSGERGMLGSVLRRRTLPRFFSMVACGRGATGSGGAGRERSGARRRRRARGPAFGFLQHGRLQHTHVTRRPHPAPPPPAYVHLTARPTRPLTELCTKRDSGGSTKLDVPKVVCDRFVTRVPLWRRRSQVYVGESDRWLTGLEPRCASGTPRRERTTGNIGAQWRSVLGRYVTRDGII
uniref:Uncharacterized protein n=1 Tax=Heliothis virescens TaxID=7102 RepID=A0A2A4JBL5_HELVI